MFACLRWLIVSAGNCPSPYCQLRRAGALDVKNLTDSGQCQGPKALVINKPDVYALLAQHVELFEALLRLNYRRLRLMFEHFLDLNTRPLQAQLVRPLLLARAYGVQDGAEVCIGLQLAHDDIAQLLGASLQRVIQELKGSGRDGALRLEPKRLVVLSREKLMALAEG